MNNPFAHNLSDTLSKTLQDLGGQEFVTEWAKDNPTEFLNLYVNASSSVTINGSNLPVQETETVPDFQTPTTIETVSVVAALDRRKAAEYLSISTRLLDNLLSTGVIQRIKVGRKTLIRRIDLDQYLNKLACEASD